MCTSVGISNFFGGHPITALSNGALVVHSESVRAQNHDALSAVG